MQTLYSLFNHYMMNFPFIFSKIHVIRFTFKKLRESFQVQLDVKTLCVIFLPSGVVLVTILPY